MSGTQPSPTLARFIQMDREMRLVREQIVRLKDLQVRQAKDMQHIASRLRWMEMYSLAGTVITLLVLLYKCLH
jgi:hypothetical protein